MKLITKKKYKKALKVVKEYELQNNSEWHPVAIIVPASGCGTIPSRVIKTRGRYNNGQHEVERYD